MRSAQRVIERLAVTRSCSASSSANWSPTGRGRREDAAARSSSSGRRGGPRRPADGCAGCPTMRPPCARGGGARPRQPVRDVAPLAGADAASAARAADALVAVHVLAADRDVIRLRPSGGAQRGVRADPAARVAGAAREAADADQARGAESERVGRHVLRLPASADPAWVGVLRAAARGASARGDADARHHYLRRALDEPPSEDERGRVRFTSSASPRRPTDARRLR